MFDFHLHSSLSFDSRWDARLMATAAREKGLREICFTDHYDCHFDPQKPHQLFTADQYRACYDGLDLPGLTVRRGVEMGLTRWNMPQAQAFLKEYPFDFVIGSVHFADGFDPYEPEYWRGKTVSGAFGCYLEEVLCCVAAHNDFDVLGHLTYVCKSAYNPTHEPLRYAQYAGTVDAILKCLIDKGKGLEVNTSGIDRVGEALPSAEFLLRFKELGGKIVTVGSDAHDPARVGQHIPKTLEMLRDIFGYVCTYQNREPVFHSL